MCVWDGGGGLDAKLVLSMIITNTDRSYQDPDMTDTDQYTQRITDLQHPPPFLHRQYNRHREIDSVKPLLWHQTIVQSIYSFLISTVSLDERRL